MYLQIEGFTGGRSPDLPAGNRSWDLPISGMCNRYIQPFLQPRLFPYLKFDQYVKCIQLCVGKLKHRTACRMKSTLYMLAAVTVSLLHLLLQIRMNEKILKTFLSTNSV